MWLAWFNKSGFSRLEHAGEEREIHPLEELAARRFFRIAVLASQIKTTRVLGTATLVEFQTVVKLVLTKTDERQTDGEVVSGLLFIGAMQLGGKLRQPILDKIGTTKHRTGLDRAAVIGPIRGGEFVVEEDVMKGTFPGPTSGWSRGLILEQILTHDLERGIHRFKFSRFHQGSFGKVVKGVFVQTITQSRVLTTFTFSFLARFFS